MLYNDLNLSVSKFAASNDTHNEAIKGVFFRRDCTVATDSFRLLEVTTDKTAKVEDMPPALKAMRGCDPFLVSAPCVSDLRKMKRGGNKKIPIPALAFIAISHVDNKKIEFTSTDLETTDKKEAVRIDGRFPDYQQLFPTGEPKASINLNAPLLSELLEVMAKIKSTHEVTIKIYTDNKPVVLEADNGSQRARALLMPIKTT